MEQKRGGMKIPPLSFFGMLEYWSTGVLEGWNVGVLETCIELST
jgi:hypothetical protein